MNPHCWSAIAVVETLVLKKDIFKNFLSNLLEGFGVDEDILGLAMPNQCY